MRKEEQVESDITEVEIDSSERLVTRISTYLETKEAQGYPGGQDKLEKDIQVVVEGALQEPEERVDECASLDSIVVDGVGLGTFLEVETTIAMGFENGNTTIVKAMLEDVVKQLFPTIH